MMGTVVRLLDSMYGGNMPSLQPFQNECENHLVAAM